MRRLALLAAAALLLSLPVASAAAQDAAGGELVVQRVDTEDHPTVRVTVSVPGAGEEATSDDAFTVVEAGEQRDVRTTKVADSALEVALVMDTTGSMAGAPITDAKAAAVTFLESLPPDARVAVLAYDDTPRVVSPLSTDRPAQMAAVAALQAQGRTALYDAVSAALSQLSAEEGTARSLVLLTDGEDNESATALPDLLDQLEAAGAPLHAITYRTSFTDSEALAEMTAAAGGSAREAQDPDALNRMYAEITAQLTSQHTLEYTSRAAGPTPTEITAALGGSRVSVRTTVELPERHVPPPAPRPETAPAPLEPAAPVGRTVEPSVWSQPAVLAGGASALFLGFAVVLVLLLRPSGRSQLSTRRTGMSARGSLPTLAGSAARAVEDGLGRRGWLKDLDARLEQAGLALRPGEYLLLLGSAALVGLVVGWAAAGPLTGLLLTAAVGAVGGAVLSSKGRRRRAAFDDQLSDTLQMLASSLRSGHGLQQAIDSVANEAESPTADELRRVMVESRLGRDLNTCLQAMGQRMGSEDFDWVVQAIAIHRDVGGNLSEVLDQVSETIRDRNQIRRQVKVLSAEGRLSAIVLLAMPFVASAALALLNPEYMAELTSSSTGFLLIALGFCLMAVGAIWIRRLIRLVF